MHFISLEIFFNSQIHCLATEVFIFSHKMDKNSHLQQFQTKFSVEKYIVIHVTIDMLSKTLVVNYQIVCYKNM